MASDFEKPDKVHTLFPEEIEEKMWPMPVRDLFLVGQATEKKLARLGIRTIGELARTDAGLLRAHLKKHGEVIREFANGHDASLVESEPQDNKGYGSSTTIAFDVADVQTAKHVLLALSETVAARLRKHGKKAELISIEIKSSDLHTVSHQMLLQAPSDITYEIHQTACRLFDELWDGSPIRLLGIRAGRLGDKEARQLNIFDHTDYGKLERLDAALDHIRERHGRDAVMRASFLCSPIDHMSGAADRLSGEMPVDAEEAKDRDACRLTEPRSNTDEEEQNERNRIQNGAPRPGGSRAGGRGQRVRDSRQCQLHD